MNVRPPNIQDVAALAGCSPATVSRALNNPELVKPTTRDAVLDAARKLGFVGNNAARVLRQKKTNMIGVIIPTLQHAIYADFVESLQQEFADSGYILNIATSNYTLEKELIGARKFIEVGVDGLILVGNIRHPELNELIYRSRTPVVNTYTYDVLCARSTVGIDNEGVFREIIQYLVSLGHRDICMISGFSTGNDRAQLRIKGFKAGLRERSLPIESSRIVEGPYSLEGGRQGLCEILKNHRPTAIVCGSDMLALGALLECQDQGIAVPDDMSIFGMDDLDISRIARPAISTMHVSADELGRVAADALLSLCAGASEVTHHCVEVTPIVRQTTGPAP